MQEQRSDRVEDGDDEDGEVRRVAAVAAGRLAVAADPVGADGEQERGDAEGLQLRRVHEQPGHEARRRAEERAAQERHAEQRHEQQVRHRARDVDRREERDLDQRGDEEERRRLDDVRGHGSDGVGRRLLRTTTESSEPKRTNGEICTSLYSDVSVWPTLVTLPIWIPRG